MSYADRFQAPIAVRFKDIDAMGHVNNAVIFTYFEEGRKALFHAAFNASAPGGFTFVLAHAECDYLRRIRLEDALVVALGVSHIGRKSFGLTYALFDPHDHTRRFATGSSIQVCYDYQRQESILVPPRLKEVLAIYRLPA